jgi:hypothetical protein
MSYQLVFWHAVSKAEFQGLYSRISHDDHLIPGLSALNILAIESAVLRAHERWIVDARLSDGHTQTALRSESGALDISYTSQSVTVTFYGLGTTEVEAVTKMMLDRGLECFDPQRC